MAQMSGPGLDPNAGAEPDSGDPRVSWAGAPLRSTLLFLAVPAAVAFVILVLDLPVPSWALYGIGGVLGLVLLGRVFRDPEWLLATFIFYIPFKRSSSRRSPPA